MSLFCRASSASYLYLDNDRTERMHPLSVAAEAASVTTTHLWASSYDGTVTTLALKSFPKNNVNLTTTYSLTKTYSTTDCIFDPSWLTLDYSRQELFCIGEGLKGPYGGLTIFAASPDGELKTRLQQRTIPGGVYGTLMWSSSAATAKLDGFAIAH